MSELIDLDYRPTEDEPFMNERQKSYFRAKLVAWKNDILREARETLEALQQENANHPDRRIGHPPKRIGQLNFALATDSAN